MTVIRLKGTFNKDVLPNIGITDQLAAYMASHRLTRIPFNGILELEETRNPTDRAPVAVFRVAVLEPAIDDDGTDPDGRAEQTLQMIDQARKSRNLAPAERTLFDHPGGDDGGGETRMGPDGPHEVPPPSGEELEAELRERDADGDDA